MMYLKYRATALLVGFLGFSSLTRTAHAEPSVTGNKPVNKPYQDLVGRDVSQNGWSSWQAPVGTVDPSRLIPSDDSSNSTEILVAPVDPHNSNSFELSDTLGKTTTIEETKPIERVESSATDADDDQPTAPMAAAAPKSESKRVMVIGGGCVALLAFRKFRRPSNVPKKPSFL
jgi:hypothetical protein